ncbi:MAG: hypothetical protein HDT26_07475 [Subdoligranulum sp.]|nr:hypothetical protein [Subdoligranulum sp.]
MKKSERHIRRSLSSISSCSADPICILLSVSLPQKYQEAAGTPAPKQLFETTLRQSSFSSLSSYDSVGDSEYTIPKICLRLSTKEVMPFAMPHTSFPLISDTLFFPSAQPVQALVLFCLIYVSKLQKITFFPNIFMKIFPYGKAIVSPVYPSAPHPVLPA